MCGEISDFMFISFGGEAIVSKMEMRHLLGDTRSHALVE